MWGGDWWERSYLGGENGWGSEQTSIAGGARTSGTGVSPGPARETQAVKVVRAAESPRGQDTRLGWEVLGNL